MRIPHLFLVPLHGTNEWLNDKNRDEKSACEWLTEKIDREHSAKQRNRIIEREMSLFYRKNRRQSRKFAYRHCTSHMMCVDITCIQIHRRTTNTATHNNKIFPSTNYACFYSVISAIWRYPTLNLAQKYSLFLFRFESILGIFFLILYQKLILCKIMRTLVL